MAASSGEVKEARSVPLKWVQNLDIAPRTQAVEGGGGKSLVVLVLRGAGVWRGRETGGTL